MTTRSFLFLAILFPILTFFFMEATEGLEAVPMVVAAGDRAQDSMALVALYNATHENGPWTNEWDLEQPMDTWYGVRLNEEGCVTYLDLDGEVDFRYSFNSLGNNLRGIIPIDLGNLVNLEFLDLSDNQLVGSIPADLGNLYNLTELYFFNNQLTGSIPVELGNLSNLKILFLFNNQLNGNIPPQLGNLFKLTSLDFFNNQLTGSIPTELSKLNKLELLGLSNNQLTGSIPIELGNLTNLIRLSLSDNQLKGSIPEELGFLINLTDLSISNNELTGNIPPQLGNLSNLTELYLFDNALTGDIPIVLGNLVKLEDLILSSNQLIGSIPEEFGNLSNLSSLYLHYNQLTGSIPPTLGILPDLKLVLLNNNNLEGCIPNSFSKFCQYEQGVISPGYDLRNNPKLAWQGDLTNFCNNKSSIGAPCDDGNPNTENDLIQADCSCQGTISQMDCAARDRAALIALYLATDGGNWTTPWDTTQTMDTWYRVRLNNDGCVEEIDLTSNDLVGNIPPELGNLSNLTSLELGFNQLTGGIPAELGNLLNLSRLELFNNGLTGSIPAALGNLSNLTALDFGTNQLTGSIPVELGNLSNLTRLDLSRNDLIGNIPIELGNLSNLEGFLLSNNQLTGSIPVELGKLTKLFGLYLSNNDLIGNLPSELGEIDALQIIELDNNDLDGCIPDNFSRFCQYEQGGGSERYDFRNNTKLPWQGDLTSFCNNESSIGAPCDDGNPNTENDLIQADCSCQGTISQMDCAARDRAALIALYLATDGDKWLNRWDTAQTMDTWYGITTNANNCVTMISLASNGLLDSLPAELGSLSNLIDLNLSFNQLTGSIPIELGNLSSLNWLDLSSNQLTGSIPVELGNLSSLNWLFLDSNQLTGSIPVELGNLSNLTNLRLSINQLTGSIPVELGNLSSLNGLDLSSNQLTGSIPVELGILSNLTLLDLSSNQLTRSIPVELSNLSKLNALVLSNNQLTGSIPLELGNLSNLQYLFLFVNQLAGSIPAELGTLANLKRLNLQNNQLTESIPMELGNLSNLEELYLHENQLKGNIPSALGDLDQLKRLYLNNNQLSGCFPASFSNFCVLPYNSEYDGLYEYLGQTIYYYNEDGYNLGNNAGLSWQGDFQRFCDREDSTSVFCDDGNPTTINDKINENCECIGEELPVGCRKLDSLILLQFAVATDSANWLTKWDTLQPLDTWEGITLDEEGCVIAIEFNNNGLSGRLISALGNLEKLRVLTLTADRLQGAIPSELGQLQELVSLDLSNNKLDGGIPDELGSLLNLQILKLSDNELAGAIPNAIGQLSNLLQLDLSGNLFLNGEIPAELANLQQLKLLLLFNNRFSGEIPAAIGSITTLEGLDLSGNQLTGAIPAAIINLSNLKALYLNGNRLEGCYPTDFEQFCSFGFSTDNSQAGYNLSNNKGLAYQGDFEQYCTEGTFSAVGATCDDDNFNTINDVIGEDCKCKGALPPSCSTLDSLTLLAIYKATHTEQKDWIKKWDKLAPLVTWRGVELNAAGCVIALQLPTNQLSGKLPMELSDLESLEVLDLSGNDLDGNISEALQNLAALRTVNLQANHFTFEDVLPLLAIPTYEYASQAPFLKETNYPMEVGADLEIDLIIDATTNNSYQAYRAGVLTDWSFADNRARLANITLEDDGVYTIRATNIAAPDLTLESENIRINVACPSNITIDGWSAGEDQEECGESSLLSGTIPDGYTAKWETDSKATILSPNELSTDVNNLEVGENRFSLVLSTDKCEGLSRDEVIITRNNQDRATEDDEIQVVLGDSSEVFDITANDRLSNNWTIEIIDRPRNGSLHPRGDGMFIYRHSNIYNKYDEFVYEVCEVNCPEICTRSRVILEATEKEYPFPFDPGFSPNGDGVNDELVFLGLEDFKKAQLVIFNVNGDEVFKTKSYKNNWNGINQENGKPLPEGVYYFQLKPNLVDRDELSIGGYITILR